MCEFSHFSLTRILTSTIIYIHKCIQIHPLFMYNIKINHWLRHGLIIQILTRGIDVNSWCYNIYTRIEMDSWYFQRLMVQTCIHGNAFTYSIVSALLTHSCTRVSSVARMRAFFYPPAPHLPFFNTLLLFLRDIITFFFVFFDGLTQSGF